MIKKATVIGVAPQLVVTDIAATANYYCNVLGFSIIGIVGTPSAYAMVQRDGYQIHFGLADNGTTNPNVAHRKIAFDLVIWVPEIDLFFDEVKGRGADVTTIVQRPYGREFIITDCNGYRISVCD